jgi:hypothetical protein
MEQPPTVDAIYLWLVSFLDEFAKIPRGVSARTAFSGSNSLKRLNPSPYPLAVT